MTSDPRPGVLRLWGPEARARVAAAGLLLAAAACGNRSDETEQARPVEGTAPHAAVALRGSGAGQVAAPIAPTANPVAPPIAPTIASPIAMPPAAPPPAAAMAAPPLPYTYMGTLQERGMVYVFLQRSGIPHRITGPGPLDAQYSVEAVEPRRIVLRHLALGTLQEIRLDAAPAAAVPTVTPLAPPEPVVLDSEGRPLPIEK